MVPRVDIVAMPVDTPFADAARQMAEHGHSRVPVYRETLDDVIGMVHFKDLLPYAVDGRAVPLADLVRKVLFVAPSMPVLDLLLQMRLSRMHMALVVDEFGGIDGLVTIEDVIEEIVGEIEDEHDDADQPKLIERGDGTVIADARTPIEALEARAGAQLRPPGGEEVHTLGGLVFALAGRVPARGEAIKHPGGPRIRGARRRSAPRQAAAGARPAARRGATMAERPDAPISVLFHTAGPLSPLQRAALGAAGLAGWPRYIMALLLGALAAMALPPFDLAPVLLVSFVGLVWLEDGSADRRASFRARLELRLRLLRRRALLDRGGAVRRYRAVLVAAAVRRARRAGRAGALHRPRALLASHAICQRLSLGGTARIVVLAACWAVAEWLRGHVLTGFPWNLIGYAWAGGFPGGLAMLQTDLACLGIYGLSLLTVLAAALPARLGDLTGGRRAAPLAALAHRRGARRRRRAASRAATTRGDGAGHDACAWCSLRSRRASRTIPPPTPPISAASWR